MIPNDRAFSGRETFEEDGKIFYRFYKFGMQGKFQMKIQVISINSDYHQAIAFSLSTDPKFKGTLLINGQRFVPEKKKINYVMPVKLPDNIEIIMDFDVVEGYIYLANASDFLDDYPEIIEKISAQTGRSREQFRGCSFTSGFSAANMYGNAFWVEVLSDNRYRFHCNDHKLDDDFDDLIFDVEVVRLDDWK